MIVSGESWISRLPVEVRRRLDGSAVSRTYRPGEEITRAGRNCLGVHQLVEGYVRLTGLNSCGETALIAIYGPGTSWGETAVISGRAHHHTTLAMTTTRVRLLPRAEFLRACADHPEAREALCGKLADSISRLLQTREERASENMGCLVARSFLSFLEDDERDADQQNSYSIEVPLTQNDIAQFLGVTRQSIHPEIAALKAAGILEKRGSSWVVHDIRRLRRFSRARAFNNGRGAGSGPS